MQGMQSAQEFSYSEVHSCKSRNFQAQSHTILYSGCRTENKSEVSLKTKWVLIMMTTSTSHNYIIQFSTLPVLGMFIKLQKATISFIMSVCLSIYMEQLGSHWKDCHEIWCSSIFQKSVKKIRVSLQSEKNNGYFTWWQIYIYYHISLSYT